MNGCVVVDTLQLNVHYPKADVFNHWNKYASNADPRKLRTGIVADEFVVRGGGSGYKFSVWQHDARAYLTNYVDEICGEGHGMGIWLQLGPKFLLHHINNLQAGVAQLLDDLGVSGSWPIKITRLDLAADLFGVFMTEQDVTSWKHGWVGRSKPSSTYSNSRTGNLETLCIGSRQSAVYLRIYDKVAQAVKEGDINYWTDVWKEIPNAVTRVEWEVKPGEGNFSISLRNFDLLNGFAFRELGNYLLDWGRLCIPDESEANKSRWENAPFWHGLEEVINRWSEGVDWPTSRYGKVFHGVSEAYIKHLSGTISGGMARLASDKPSMIEMFERMGEFGEDLETINKKAADKAAVISKL